MNNQRVTVAPFETVIVGAAGLGTGERYLIRYVLFSPNKIDCGAELEVVDFSPNGCQHYIGHCGPGQGNTGNPVVLDTPGVYEFVFDGLSAPADGLVVEVERWTTRRITLSSE